MHITIRPSSPEACQQLQQAGIPPLLARLYAARGVQSAGELDESLTQLLPPDDMQGLAAAATLLADALAQQQRLCIVADYDCDGATACATAIRGLRMLGAQHVDYLVPDRVQDGYGLTPAIADRVAARGADVLITVDNGIASVDGVAHAHALGLRVLVTDHHLPAVNACGQTLLPAADALVNPNQPGCPFASKALAGVGVMFYVLLALRAELRQRGHFASDAQPRLDTLLPLVALGTVADVVRLDANNRRLVAQGLHRIRQGRLPAGMQALFEVSGRSWQQASTFDMGFALGPRINAAGRLADMTIGIECLLADDAGRASELARQLDAINRERRQIEGDMREQALHMADRLFASSDTPPAAISVFQDDFHEGVVGIVASRIKDQLHRPTFVFAASQAEGMEDVLKGSGRSIAGFHLRDALDLVSKRHPDVLLKFGGHAMAAGCSIHRAQFATFARALEQVAQEWLDDDALQRTLHTDGPLPAASRTLHMADSLRQGIWGAGFAAPTFSEEMDVVQQRVLQDKHLKLRLRHQGELIDAIWFNHNQPLPARAHLAYRLDVNEWQGQRSLQLIVEGMAEE